MRRQITGRIATTVGNIRSENPLMAAAMSNVYYGDNHAIMNVSLEIGKQEVIALIGPSGCGKSTFLRCLNRMNDTDRIGARHRRDLAGRGWTSTAGKWTSVPLRARVGMVFQKPNPFPKSIYDNVAYGPRIHGLATDKAELDEIVQTSLRAGGTAARGEGSARRNRAPACRAGSSNASASRAPSP